MNKIRVNFENTCGKVKPMHAVNNGPIYKFAVDQRITNIEPWREAGIPYARTHDAAFCATYGGEHTVDVNNIFTNFDADPYDPASYDFVLTDEYMQIIAHGGSEPFFRLGSKIEHWKKKYNTLPPKDFHKWAVICEHIIRHYTEGWGDGMKMKVEYWEIWNEPDLDPDDSTHKRTWGGTKAQFFDLYEIAAKHLKSCFPYLKIGGPALAHREDWARDFLSEMQKRETPIDFFSWHIYSNDPRKVADKCRLFRKMMDEYGYTDAESINNEWNYVRGWEGEDWIYSLKQEKSLKGAAFIASTMSLCQYAPLDMLMYYDARPGGMNGLFSTDLICNILKGYYPFRMFNELYKLGECVAIETLGENIHASAAKGENGAAVMLTHYSDDDATKTTELTLDLSNIALEGDYTLKCYLLDENNDMKKTVEIRTSGKQLSLRLEMSLFSTYLVTLEK